MNLNEKEEKYRILISRILTNKATATGSLYQIGLDLKEIKERELYLLEFRSFEEFLEKKVDISRRTAYRCIGIADEFTLRDFMKWGLKKLDIVKSQLEEPIRQEFLKSATGGTETKPLLDQIKSFKLQKGIDEVRRFSHSVGDKPRHSLDAQEHILKLKREFDTLQEQYRAFTALKDSLKESVNKWKVSANKYPELTQLTKEVEKFAI